MIFERNNREICDVEMTEIFPYYYRIVSRMIDLPAEKVTEKYCVRVSLLNVLIFIIYK